MTVDQRRHWNALRRSNPARATIAKPSAFTQACGWRFPPAATILELGCGSAGDGAYFAELGHTVCATDFSEAALNQAKPARNVTPGLQLCLIDTAAPLPFLDQAFDVVYARLSLHYFADATTRRVFGEIYRVLRPSGLLCFMCKSTADPLYGQGCLIEPDMFELNGHVRHFFSPAYAASCLDPGFALIHLEERRGNLYGKASAYIEVVAQAR